MTTCETTKTIRVSYSSPVTNCVRRLRVLPPARRGTQYTLQERWHCAPEPDAIRETGDEFGNRILEIMHRRIKREVCFQLTLLAEREHCDAPRAENLPPVGIGAFLLPSALCDLAPEIERIAGTEFGRNRSALKAAGGQAAIPSETVEETATRICGWTHQALAYTPGATGPQTTASQALGRGSGVCQDYAHLMIALCRACTIPARYISGYNPAEGGMHAWVEVLCGDTWRAFDPTHDRLTRADCVFVAAGRDFRDVSPMQGTYRGRATAKLEVRCRTQTLAGRTI